MAENEQENKHTVRDLLRIICRRWRLFLLGALAFAIASLGLAPSVLPLKYTGETRFNRRTDPASEQLMPTQSESAETLQRSLEYQLAGGEAVAKAVEELGLTVGMPRDSAGKLTTDGQMKKQSLVRDVMRRIKVTFEVRLPQFDRVAVSFTDGDPGLAQRMPDTLVKKYIDLKGKQIVDNLTASRKFLETQVNKCNDTLAKHKTEQVDFQAAHPVMTLDNPAGLQQEILQIENDIEAVRRQETVARQKYEQLAAVSELPTTQPTTQPEGPAQVRWGPNPELARLREQLRGLQEQREDATTLRHMKDNHPTIQMLDVKIARVEKQVQATPEEAVVSTIYGSNRDTRDFGQQIQKMQMAAAQGAQTELNAITRDLEQKERRRAMLKVQLEDFKSSRQAYLDIVQKVEDATKETDLWQNRLTEVQMALEAEVAKGRTHLGEDVFPAEIQFRPSSPKLSMVLAFALLGGLAAGGGLVFLANMLDRSMTTTEEAVQHFGIPVCGVIGEIVTPRDVRIRSIKRWTIGPAVWGGVLVALAIAGLNVVLWLNYPESYGDWWAHPVAFVSEHLAAAFQRLRAMI